MKTLAFNTLVVLMLIGPLADYATANESGRKHRRETRELYNLLIETREQPLMLEPWMKNTGYFTSTVFNTATESDITLKSWMYDPFYFHPAFQGKVQDDILRLEPWMYNNEHFYHHVSEAIENAILIEDWMTDPSYFHLSFLREVDDPPQKIENWMVSIAWMCKN
jgi:hypothetical protein